MARRRSMRLPWLMKCRVIWPLTPSPADFLPLCLSGSLLSPHGPARCVSRSADLCEYSIPPTPLPLTTTPASSLKLEEIPPKPLE